MALSLPFSESTISARGHYGPRLWNGAQTFHTGVDFAIAGGINIPAAESGVVTHVEYTALRGYQVQIQHGTVARTRYHMLDASIPVRAGDTVTKGQTIGKVASQRYSTSAAWTGPHLHFEVWYPFTEGSNPQYTHMDPLAFVGGQTNPAGDGNVTPIEASEFDLSQQQYNHIMTELSWIKSGIGGSNANNSIRAQLNGIRSELTALKATLDQVSSDSSSTVGKAQWLMDSISGSNASGTSGGVRPRLQEVQSEVDAILVGVRKIQDKLGA